MPHFEVKAIGEHTGRQIVSTFWYSTGEVGAVTDADLAAVLAAWRTTVRGPLLAWHTNAYVLKQEAVQGYTHDFQRMPYLPLLADQNLVGGTGLFAGPPIVAAVLSARVAPVLPGQQLDPDTGQFRLRPVRRGYWSFGPFPVEEQKPDGLLTAGTIALPRYVNLANACAAVLPVASLPSNPRPIRVSKLPEGATIRGWGNVMGCVWRAAISTRRSRKTGIGA
ncbi:MAG TPA: hypothetical protein VGW38_06045 [Chloroflexota bacterium]|nr:hypothetical protein [Chloroflexota bacterium]